MSENTKSTADLREDAREDARAEIKSLIPHREPFLYLDRIEAREGKIFGTRMFADTEWFFAGHFPGDPVVPGVILVEAMAQCGGAGVRKLGLQMEGTFLFAKIREARFRRPVRPNECLAMTVENIKVSQKIIHQKGSGSVNGELAVEAEWIAIIAST